MSKKPWRAGKDLAAVVENMEIGTGQRGDGKDAFVTQRQLAELKLAKMSGGNGGIRLAPGLGQGIFPDIPPPERPTKPEGLQVTGGFGYVLLEWVMPKYNGHSLAEIWRGTEDNLSDAVLVGTTPGQVYSDSVDPGWKGFYWIRFVNSAGVSGPYNSPDGTPAETQMDVQAVIDQIHDEAAKSPIVEELKKEISDSAKATNEHIEKISEDGGKAFQAMWAQKASADGITAGIGIVAGKDAAGNPISQVAIAASQLFIFDPNNPGNTAYPFAVSGGKVVIQKAVIYDAVVETLSAQYIVADDVKIGATLTAPYIRSATISNGNFTVDSNGNVNAVNANLNNVTSRGGAFYDLYAVGGTMGNVHILENCQIDGRLSAAQIDGDIAKTYALNRGSVYIPAQVVAMNLVVLAAEVQSHGRHGTINWNNADFYFNGEFQGPGTSVTMSNFIAGKYTVHGGGGMTNAEAAGIMDKIRRSGKQAQYDRLAGIVDDMLARRRELIKTAGLEKEGVVDAWQNAYKHYVPLKGQDTDGALPRTGRGYVVSGKESKMAMGRNSKAQSPSTQAIQDLTESLIRNRKNEVGNAFLKLVQDNPDKDYWQVFTDDKPDTTRRIVEKNDPETGETIRQVEEMPVPMAMMSDRYFPTKKDGKTYYIKLHDERLAKAMKNMGPEVTGATLRAFGSINRFLSSVNTMYNPSFLVTNFGRDLQTAVMSIYGEQGRSDGLLVGKKMSALSVVRDSGIAMKAVYDSLRGNQRNGKTGEWQKLWKEFVEDGAKTGWFRINDLEGRMKEMDRLVAQAKGGWQGQSIQSWHAFFKLVEDGNNAVENALRLSAYKHGRDAGMSRQQAASLAKNLTVNFNRRGELGTVLNSLYMFANASVQGTANMIRALGRLEGSGPLLQRLRWSNLNRTQKLSLAAMGAGYLLGSLNRAGAGQDEDGVNWYDKVPDYVKEHNLVIMKSLFGGRQGEYWTFPLPYGYNMFYLLGGTIEGVGSGGIKPVKAAGNIIGGALGAFNPLGSEDSETLSGTLLKNLSPTLPRPFIDYVMNENFMGTQIRRQNAPWGTPKPDSTLGRRSTPEVYKSFANWLNTATGGSQYRSGAVDINPDSMKYWIDYISGGTGRFIGQTVDAAAKTYNGIGIPAQQVPFLGKLSGQVMPYADQQKMYDHIDELSQYNAELKSLSGADRAAFRNKYNGQLSMNGITHQSQLQLKNLRKQRDEVYSDPTLTARQQADRVLMIEQNMKNRFNREKTRE